MGSHSVEYHSNILGDSHWMRLGIGVLLTVCVGLTSSILQAYQTRKLLRTGHAKYVVLGSRIVTISMIASLLLHGFNVMTLQWLVAVRGILGNWVFVDEFLVMLPPFVLLVLRWWCEYPAYRRIQESLLVRRLDEGKTIYPILSKQRYVWEQVRLQLAILVVPIFTLLTFSEAVDQIWSGEDSEIIRSAALVIGTGTIFIFAPLLVRLLWNTSALEQGTLREHLIRLCENHRVRVRKLLVWNTHGTVVNAVVVGFLGRLRYILVTDRLLDCMSDIQTEAVLAHEIAHVRYHHMFWLILCFVTALILATIGIAYGAFVVFPEQILLDENIVTPSWNEYIQVGASFLIGMSIFGWVSRRFERQADTFAVQHLSGMTRTGGHELNITPGAIAAMSGALSGISGSNYIPMEKRSWRHGSIGWRVRYLSTLESQQCNRIAIDSTIKYIKVATVIGIIGCLMILQYIPIHIT